MVHNRNFFVIYDVILFASLFYDMPTFRYPVHSRFRSIALLSDPMDSFGHRSLIGFLSPDAAGLVIIVGSVALTDCYHLAPLVEVMSFGIPHAFVSSVLEVSLFSHGISSVSLMDSKQR